MNFWKSESINCVEVSSLINQKKIHFKQKQNRNIAAQNQQSSSAVSVAAQQSAGVMGMDGVAGGAPPPGFGSMGPGAGGH